MGINRTRSPIPLVMYQTARKQFVISVLDDDDEPVNIMSMDLRFVVHDANGDGKFDVETGSIEKGGANSNEATVTVSPAQSATISNNWLWELWDVTTADEEAVLANGPIEIKMAVKNVV